MRCIHCVRSSISVWRNRARERHWRTCSGGIHASGNRPSASSSAASARPRDRSWRAACDPATRASPPARPDAPPRPPPPARHRRTTSPCTPPPRHRSRWPAKRATHARHRRRRRIDPAAHHLARLGVQRVEGDLRSMHIKPGYDRHQGLLCSSGNLPPRASLSRRAEEARVHAIFARRAALTGRFRSAGARRSFGPADGRLPADGLAVRSTDDDTERATPGADDRAGGCG